MAFCQSKKGTCAVHAYQLRSDPLYFNFRSICLSHYLSLSLSDFPLTCLFLSHTNQLTLSLCCHALLTLHDHLSVSAPLSLTQSHPHLIASPSLSLCISLFSLSLSLSQKCGFRFQKNQRQLINFFQKIDSNLIKFS